MIHKKKIVFLFTELSGYMLNCFNTAIENGYEVHVVFYPINKEAPFKFPNELGFFKYERSDFQNSNSLVYLLNKINPDLIFISGWIDKGYLKAVENLSLTCKKVMIMDTPWESSIKQHVWKIVFKNKYLKIFNAIWVPGEVQKKYAIKLGFSDSMIFEGLYTCNSNLFGSYFVDGFPSKQKSFPKRFLFIGRYIADKGINKLCELFAEIVDENSLDWELWCVGNGILWEKRKIHPAIKHFGFVQPNQLLEIINGTGVYVLPSKYEPWGVSLHEMATAGMPVLVSEDVGSHNYFVKNRINGLVFSHKVKNDFKDKLLQMMQYSSNELLKMGKESVHLSKKITTKTWLKTLNEIYD